MRTSEHHVGHQMVETGAEQWILISNYTSSAAADAARGMVRELVAGMSENFGMKLDVLGQGEVSRQVT
ncbi:MAG: hypothetical protein HKN72_09365 [Gemmatimonadetes bacterium]|nr:hypothetical protein [Gemmatimonadota bacterium]NNF13421.1 hypothetical protein [Gemmatimonadota bacterium]